MDRELTRRSVLGGLVAIGAVGMGTMGRELFDRFAAGSGSVWDTPDRSLPDTVESPYGPATIAYDDHGVPHISANSEEALFFAVGYAQGADRLFMMDLIRRQVSGRLAEIIGDSPASILQQDRFHTKMDFQAAAEATWKPIQDTEFGRLIQAFSAGVNRHLDRPLPPEFDLLGYEPEPWSPIATMLVEKQISWSFTGNFRTLRKATIAAEMGTEVANELYPDRYDHDATIIGHGETGPTQQSETSQPVATAPGLTEWLSTVESPPEIGSNSWVVSGEHTASGAPMLANDPHVSLFAPPVWYEMHLDGPKTKVRGVTMAGIPLTTVGETDHGAWGVTVAYTDAIDFYRYEAEDGTYRYGDETREFETETKTVAVAGGTDQTVEVKKSVHGPVVGIESDGDELTGEIGIAWTGLTATQTGEALLSLIRSQSLDEAHAALSNYDLPSLNIVYANRDGETLYQVVGKVPIRKTDGEPVAGTRVFNGSDKAGEWPGYVPYGESSWVEDGGVIPFEEMPHEINPDYLGTANQRIVEDAAYPHYLSASYATPFRGMRLWDRLDRRVDADEPVDRAFMKSLQRDTHDGRAAAFVPTMLEASSEIDGRAVALLESLEDWEYHMDRDSKAALIFSRFIPHYRDVVFGPRLTDALDDRRDPSEYYGDQWVTVTLDPESAWFPDGQPAAIQEALERTADELEEQGWETFGDYNTADFAHQLDQEWLQYPSIPTDGAEGSLNNYWRELSVGSSWRQLCPMDKSDGPSEGTFPGGNTGLPFSAHYHDQLEQWANVEYKPIGLELPDDATVMFTEESTLAPSVNSSMRCETTDASAGR